VTYLNELKPSDELKDHITGLAGSINEFKSSLAQLDNVDPCLKGYLAPVVSLGSQVTNELEMIGKSILSFCDRVSCSQNDSKTLFTDWNVSHIKNWLNNLYDAAATIQSQNQKASTDLLSYSQRVNQRISEMKSEEQNLSYESQQKRNEIQKIYDGLNNQTQNFWGIVSIGIKSLTGDLQKELEQDMEQVNELEAQITTSSHTVEIFRNSIPGIQQIASDTSKMSIYWRSLGSDINSAKDSLKDGETADNSELIIDMQFIVDDWNQVRSITQKMLS
jgi:hypothetical protein